MKVELHLHTKRYSPCASATPAELLTTLVRMGYEAVYITEHDRLWADWELYELRAEYPAIRIFPGVELSMADSSEHILVLGARDPAFLELRNPKTVVEMAKKQGHLVILAHPFRWTGGAAMLDNGVRPDALEYRSNNHDAEGGAKSVVASRQYDLPLVNAGDTHNVGMLGRFWIETDRPIEQADDIRQIVKAGNFTIRSRD